MIRCAHFIPHVRLEEGGVVRAVLDLCRVLAGAGHEVTLVTCDAADVPAEWREGSGAGVPRVVEVEGLRGALQLLTKGARERVAGVVGGVDVVHLHAPWVTANVQVAGIARRLGRPYVLTAHGMLDEWSMGQKRLKKRIYLALAGNRLLAGAARVHCTAEAELDQARRWMPRENGVVLPLVVDLAEYVEPPGAEMARGKFPALGGEGWKLLFLSRVHPKKGVELLIRAAAELRRRGRACTVLIAGPGEAGYVDSLKRLAGESGVGDAVHFLGMVRGAEKLSLYAAADVFVLPTSQENFGLVLVEAMACRTPVVTTRGVDIWKELQGAGAEIVDSEVGAIAAGVEAVMGRAGTEALGERGRRWVMAELDPSRVVGEYAAMYEAVAREAAASSASKLAR